MTLVDFLNDAQIIKTQGIENYRSQSLLHSDPEHALVVQFQMWSAEPKPKTDQGRLTWHEDAIQEKDLTPEFDTFGVRSSAEVERSTVICSP